MEFKIHPLKFKIYLQANMNQLSKSKMCTTAQMQDKGSAESSL
jgi:hypothetical protein